MTHPPSRPSRTSNAHAHAHARAKQATSQISRELSRTSASTMRAHFGCTSKAAAHCRLRNGSLVCVLCACNGRLDNGPGVTSAVAEKKPRRRRCRVGGNHGSKPKALIHGLELFRLSWKHFNPVREATNDLLVTYLRAEAVVLTA